MANDWTIMDRCVNQCKRKYFKTWKVSFMNRIREHTVSWSDVPFLRQSSAADVAFSDLTLLTRDKCYISFGKETTDASTEGHMKLWTDPNHKMTLHCTNIQIHPSLYEDQRAPKVPYLGNKITGSAVTQLMLDDLLVRIRWVTDKFSWRLVFLEWFHFERSAEETPENKRYAANVLFK